MLGVDGTGSGGTRSDDAVTFWTVLYKVPRALRAIELEGKPGPFSLVLRFDQLSSAVRVVEALPHEELASHGNVVAHLLTVASSSPPQSLLLDQCIPHAHQAESCLSTAASLRYLLQDTPCLHPAPSCHSLPFTLIIGTSLPTPCLLPVSSLSHPTSLLADPCLSVALASRTSASITSSLSRM